MKSAFKGGASTSLSLYLKHTFCLSFSPKMYVVLCTKSYPSQMCPQKMKMTHDLELNYHFSHFTSHSFWLCSYLFVLLCFALLCVDCMRAKR